jgi:hypothetical protein
MVTARFTMEDVSRLEASLVRPLTALGEVEAAPTPADGAAR